MAKLLKLRRGTTTQHASFTGAEGEVTVDTTKDTTVVHDGSTAGGTPLAKEDMSNVSSASIAGRLSNDSIAPSKIGAGTLPSDVTVASANIVNGTIVGADIANDTITATQLANGAANVNVLLNGAVTNAKVNSSAAIAGTKISPNFGSQTIATTGQLTVGGNTTIDGTLKLNSNAPILHVYESDNNKNFYIVGDSNNLTVRMDGTAGSDTIQRWNSDGHIDFNTNCDFSSGIDVTGDIVVTGTVDGVDIAAKTLLFDHLTSTNGVLANGVVATTQSAGDNSTKVATTAYTDTAVANLVDSSPSALNTLNELAAAINDDASFSTTVNNNIATKMPLAGGEFTGNVTCENITPDADSSRNLGTNSVRFANVYADNFVGSGASLSGIEAFVTGMILLWSGASNAIPSGFVLCDGNNSTPDLRNRFVIGAGNTYSVNDTGGSTTINGNVTHSHSTPNHTHGLNGHTHSTPNHSHSVNSHSHSTPNHSHSVSNHTHSISGSVSGNTNNTGGHSHSVQMANWCQTSNMQGPSRLYGCPSGSIGTNSSGNHNHSFSGSFSGNSGNSAPNTTSSGASNTGNAGANTNNSGSGTSGAANGNTTSAGGSNTGNSGSGSTVSVLNPYYALCYIMKT